MAETALDIITSTMLDLGVLADEETPTASQAAGALRKLNNMIDAWNIEGLMVFGGKESVFALTPNKETYTVGTGGDFNIPRPTTINKIYIRDNTNSTPYDMAIPIWNQDEYSGVAYKTQTQAYPLGVYKNEKFPLTELTFWPIPTNGGYSAVLWTNDIIGEFLLNDVISLAPGYKRAIEANLAIELAASYQVALAPSVVEIARTSKADLKTNNFTLDTLSIDPILGGVYYDISIGRYR